MTASHSQHNFAQLQAHKIKVKILNVQCDSDSDEYRGPDSNSEGEGGWEGQPGVSIQPDRIANWRTPTDEHPL
jgi:hypothetical protein